MKAIRTDAGGGPAGAEGTAPRTSTRIASIDLLRGAVMVLMAIDHVRVFAGVPAGGPTAGLFFTRWVTHFCAPAFLFLAGTSAYLYGRKRDDLPRFLWTRGVWLVLLELTFLRVAWTFNFEFAQYEMAGVIWVIGCCMILMAGLVKLPLRAIAAIGIAIIAGHNLFDSAVAAAVGTTDTSAATALGKILYLGFRGGPIRFGSEGPTLIVLYSIIPWIGVMAAGYAFAPVLRLEPARRDRVALAVGLGATALFLVLRGFDLYGDPFPWRGGRLPPLFAFLSPVKYPASLLFLLMTLGPTIASIPLLERARGRVADGVALFGRVPFFFYMLHIPLIHLLAVAYTGVRDGGVSPWLFTNHPMGNPPAPDGYVWSLAELYAVWAVAIAILYVACRWFADLKRRRNDWWLRYL
jgi:uncharacterized membrane protein